jgi:hypothetical protein
MCDCSLHDRHHCSDNKKVGSESAAKRADISISRGDPKGLVNRNKDGHSLVVVLRYEVRRLDCSVERSSLVLARN